jgi:transcriptional regulator with XRE-family HTH domain
MDRNKLTLETAAKALGMSRRMLAYYRNGEISIPKYVWLACLGWEHSVGMSIGLTFITPATKQMNYAA